jgi:hypothetical protein
MVGIRIATLSDAKAGRLPLGFRSRENLANRPNDRQMTAQAGAILNTSSTWDAVDWRIIEDGVRRLQARIVKAVQQKKWNKVKALNTVDAQGSPLRVRLFMQLPCAS